MHIWEISILVFLLTLSACIWHCMYSQVEGKLSWCHSRDFPSSHFPPPWSLISTNELPELCRVSYRVNVSKIFSRACLIKFSINCLRSSLSSNKTRVRCVWRSSKLRHAIKSGKLSVKCSTLRTSLENYFVKWHDCRIVHSSWMRVEAV